MVKANERESAITANSQCEKINEQIIRPQPIRSDLMVDSYVIFAQLQGSIVPSSVSVVCGEPKIKWKKKREKNNNKTEQRWSFVIIILLVRKNNEPLKWAALSCACWWCASDGSRDLAGCDWLWLGRRGPGAFSRTAMSPGAQHQRASSSFSARDRTKYQPEERKRSNS